MKRTLTVLLTLALCAGLFAAPVALRSAADPPDTKYTVIAYGDEVNTDYFPTGYGMVNQRIVDDPAEQNPCQVSVFDKKIPGTGADPSASRYFEKAFYSHSGGQVDLSPYAGQYLAIDVLAEDAASLAILDAQTDRGTSREGFYLGRPSATGVDIGYTNFQSGGPYPNAKLGHWFTLYAQIPADKAAGYDYINVCFAPNPNDYDVNGQYSIYYRYLRVAATVSDLKLNFTPLPGLGDPISVPFQQEYAAAGKPLSISVGYGTDAFTYQWTVNGAAVNSLSDTYIPTTADLEKFIEVTATDTANKQIYTAKLYFSTLPVVYIDTETGGDVTSEEVYINADMRMQGNDQYNTATTTLYNGAIQIKGRGNNTWGLPKKPYKLKLNKKTDVFGMGTDKHWVMLADYNDQSLMRNLLSQDFAAGNTDNFTTQLTSVQCVLNGNYQGLYQFGEQVRIDPTRVDIYDWENEAQSIADLISKAQGFSAAVTTDFETAMNNDMSWVTAKKFTFNGVTYDFSKYGITFPDITDPNQFGGFLMSTDMYTGKSATEYYTSLGAHVQAINPEYIGTNSTFFGEVQDYFNAFEACTKSPDYMTTYNGQSVSYSDLFDMESLVDYYFAYEVTANPDFMNNSTNWYKGIGEKAKFGPPWDFDWSMGKWWGGTMAPDLWLTKNYGGQNGNVMYYRNLLADPYFLVRAYEHWQKIRPAIINDMLKPGGTVDQLINKLQGPGAANHMRWYGQSASGAANLISSEDQFVKNYLTQRVAWFDAQFSSLSNFVSSTGYYVKSGNLDITAIDKGRGDGYVAVTAAVRDPAMVKAVFYVNGQKYAPVAVSNASATVLVPETALDTGDLNVVQVRALNSDGSFNMNGSAASSAYGTFTYAVPLVSIGVNPAASVEKGTAVKLAVTYNPANTSDDKTAMWYSSNPSVATVSNDGTVSAVAVGTADITANVGGKTAVCKITVTSALVSVSVKPAAAVLAGTAETLAVTYDPGDTTADRTVTWTSSDPAVAAVSSDGAVTGVKPGTAQITAIVGGKTAVCQVTVILLGDVNGDGGIDTTDTRIVLQSIVGKAVLDDPQKLAADVNRDGKIDTTDARLILQYVVKKIDTF